MWKLSCLICPRGGGESYERIQKVIREIKIFDFIMKNHYKIIKEASSILL
jgi:hypothetical protein